MEMHAANLRPPTVTILLVEDEDSVREVTRQVLEGGGYHVLAAAGPLEALQIAESFEGHIHLLLTDIVMPMMNGRELANALSQSYPGMIRVFMSGYANDSLLRERLGKSTESYIQKPFTLTGLLARVSEALSLPVLPHRGTAASSLPM